jgi:hypothetical protein
MAPTEQTVGRIQLAQANHDDEHSCLTPDTYSQRNVTMTNPIPMAAIKEMVVEVTHLSSNSSNELLQDLDTLQPAIMEYLEYMEEKSPIENDASVFSRIEYRYVYLITVVMLKMLVDSHRWFDEVTWDDINATIQEVQPFATELLRDPTALPELVERLAEDHVEPELLRFLVEATQKRVDDKPNLPPIRAKYRPMAFLIFYTILTAVLNKEET